MKGIYIRTILGIAACAAVSLCAAASRTMAIDPEAVQALQMDSLRSARDSVNVARVDTVVTDSTSSDHMKQPFVPPSSSVWTMEELKAILDAENVSLESGVYRPRRSGRVAMLCSAVFPGLGQMYNEKPLKAAIAMGAETFYTYMILHNRRMWQREKQIRDLYPVNSWNWNFHDAWVR